MYIFRVCIWQDSISSKIETRANRFGKTCIYLSVNKEITTKQQNEESLSPVCHVPLRSDGKCACDSQIIPHILNFQWNIWECVI